MRLYHFIIGFAVSWLLTACSIHKLTKIRIYKELPAAEYQAYVKDSSVNIIDVRTPGEFEKSHIEGALNISYFTGHFIDHLALLNLDTTRTLLIYCETQHRSLMVARKIARSGFTSIIDLDKGMAQWRKDGFHFIGENNP